MNSIFTLGYVLCLSHLQSQENDKTHQQAPIIHPPALIPSRISLTGSITHWLPLAESNGRADAATAALPHASSLCPRAAHRWLHSTRSTKYTQDFVGTATWETFLSAGKHKCPVSVTVCTNVLNVKNRQRVLKPKFCKTLLRLVMTFVNECTFWSGFPLGTPLRSLIRKPEQPFDKYW